jgi:methylmalonyl-CoA/ethylmalonyl-CoA epimerase
MEEKLDLTQIHHINLLVRDIEAAKQSYRDVFNVDFIDEALPSRGVLTSRFKVGDAWLVLVQPVAEGCLCVNCASKEKVYSCCLWL